MNDQIKNDSTDTLAMIIEGVFGFFGLLGVGWMYVGSVGKGLLMMLGMWVFIAVESIVGVLTGGLAMCLFVPLHLVALVFSAIKVRDHVRQTGAQGSGTVIIVAIIAMVVFCVILFFVVPIILTFVAVSLGGVFEEILNSVQ
jgi:hypothetical protein